MKPITPHPTLYHTLDSFRLDPRTEMLLAQPTPRGTFLRPVIAPALAERAGSLPRFTIQQGMVYEGATPDGPVVYCHDEHHVYEGSTTLGAPLATLDGELLYRGRGGGDPMAVVRAPFIYSPTSQAPVAAVPGGSKMDAATAAWLFLSDRDATAQGAR